MTINSFTSPRKGGTHGVSSCKLGNCQLKRVSCAPFTKCCGGFKSDFLGHQTNYFRYFLKNKSGKKN